MKKFSVSMVIIAALTAVTILALMLLKFGT